MARSYIDFQDQDTIENLHVTHQISQGIKKRKLHVFVDFFFKFSAYMKQTSASKLFRNSIN